MPHQITLNDIRDNTLFWYSYISWFNGYDEKKEINIDEALEETGIIKSNEELYEWRSNFFPSNSFISGQVNDELHFHIEFQENEITYFLNDSYIGNLGGHFEAWFLTLDELSKFGSQDLLFMLLLPMTGIEKRQIRYSKNLITKHLTSISRFEDKAAYIAECIVNGLVITGEFHKTEKGIINDQNHSVRNINKYPRYIDNVLKLNESLKRFTGL
ncbi:MAG: Imm19 family immunity protein [Thermonemataceae bacterium]